MLSSSVSWRDQWHLSRKSCTDDDDICDSLRLYWNSQCSSSWVISRLEILDSYNIQKHVVILNVYGRTEVPVLSPHNCLLWPTRVVFWWSSSHSLLPLWAHEPHSPTLPSWSDLILYEDGFFPCYSTVAANQLFHFEMVSACAIITEQYALWTLNFKLWNIKFWWMILVLSFVFSHSLALWILSTRRGFSLACGEVHSICCCMEK